MAGGMGRREQGPSLAARSRDMKAGSGSRHCWVADEGAHHPGLLLEWRQQNGAWEGLVAFVRVDESGFALVQAWLDSHQLSATRPV